jgi:uncharacterized protein (DUF1800 family)
MRLTIIKRTWRVNVKTFAFYYMLALCAPALAAPAKKTPAPKPPAALTEEQKARHVLNRLAFGPRPGEVERVKAMGSRAWVDEQLAWEKIDDSAVDRKAAFLVTVSYSPERLAGVYRESQKSAVKAALKDKQGDPAPPDPEEVRRQREARALAGRVVGELQLDKTLRAAESNRQLYEVLVDFWSNHFNIDVRKQQARTLKTADERDVIRQHATGKFRELLEASAKSPAMLVYLDNFRSVTPAPPGRAKARGGLNENYARELLELHTMGVDGGYTQKDVQEVARCLTGWSINPASGVFRFYPARHDTGAKTVLGVAIPAGGGIEDGEKVLDILCAHPSTARFIARKLCVRFISDDPPATVVDRAAATFKKTDGDIRETVRCIVTSSEFYSPQAYGAKVKTPFEYAVSAVRALDGEVRIAAAEAGPGLATMQAVGAAVSSAAGEMKGAGRRVADAGNRGIVGQVARMGQPLFMCQPPTGYPDEGRQWLSAGGLMARMSYAVALTRGEILDVRLPGTGAVPAPDTAKAATLQQEVLGSGVSAATRDSVKKQAEPQAMLAMLIGSPEFQKR